MKKFFLAVVATAALVAAPAFADTAVGVVNIGKIMKDSKAAVSVRNQLQAKQKTFQADLDAKVKAMRDEDQALVKEKKAGGDKAAFDKKVEAFREKQVKEERAIQEKKGSLDKAYMTSVEEIQKNVLDIVKQVAGEKKMNLVVSSAQVLYGDDALDITDEVLKRLDAKLPSVAVKF